MKKISFVLPVTALFLLFMGAQMNYAAEKAKSVSGNKKILVAYFSHTGNTREIADQIQKITGGDIFEIKSVKTYPQDYNKAVNVASDELKSGVKPALKTKVENIKQYDTVFIGYPIWWGTYPAPVKTFLSEYDLSGKTIVPFCTHGGSGLGRSVSDISKLCPKSTLLEGLAIPGSSVGSAQNKVSEWLKKIKVTK